MKIVRNNLKCSWVRALKWPRHFSNSAAVTALDIESISARLLVRKLSFLRRLLDENATGVGAVAIKLLTYELDSLCLVKECRRVGRRVGRKLWNHYTDMNIIKFRELLRLLMANFSTFDPGHDHTPQPKPNPLMQNIYNEKKATPTLFSHEHIPSFSRNKKKKIKWPENNSSHFQHCCRYHGHHSVSIHTHDIRFYSKRNVSATHQIALAVSLKSQIVWAARGCAPFEPSLTGGHPI